MLTPIFNITQDSTHLLIKIKAPHARISQTEIFIEDQDFRFFSKPYYLRLTLPSKVIENGEELADYDSKSGTFLIKVSKLNAGEHFEGLELLTKLLSNCVNKQQINNPLIEVIEKQQTTDNTSLEAIEDDFDWHFQQTIHNESEQILLEAEKYGFAHIYSGIVARISEEFGLLIDIKDPEHKNSAQRRKERFETETKHFSDDHYLSDMFDQKELIFNIISFEVLVTKCDKEYEFSDEHRFRLKNLPKKEYIFDKMTKKRLLLSMIDILFGYAYDMRVNECEANVESGWTISKLSATLSWFDSYSSLKDVVISCVRRSLIYPLYRDWNLSLKILQDVINILKLGQNYVLKCFLDIHKMFNESGDSRYLLNDIYITDYCVWLQYVKPHTLQSMATALQTIQITKNDVHLDLDILETAAKLALHDHNHSSTQFSKIVYRKESDNIDSDDNSDHMSDDNDSDDEPTPQ